MNWNAAQIGVIVTQDRAKALPRLRNRSAHACDFELLSEQHVSVLACLHHRRNPARWPSN